MKSLLSILFLFLAVGTVNAQNFLCKSDYNAIIYNVSVADTTKIATFDVFVEAPEFIPSRIPIATFHWYPTLGLQFLYNYEGLAFSIDGVLYNTGDIVKTTNANILITFDKDVLLWNYDFSVINRASNFSFVAAGNYEKPTNCTNMLTVCFHGKSFWRNQKAFPKGFIYVKTYNFGVPFSTTNTQLVKNLLNLNGFISEFVAFQLDTLLIDRSQSSIYNYSKYIDVFYYQLADGTIIDNQTTLQELFIAAQNSLNSNNYTELDYLQRIIVNLNNAKCN